MPISEVFNEDCMIGMSRYPDKFFDLAIVDPPYGIGEDGRRKESREINASGTNRIKVDKRNGRAAVIKVNNYKVGEYDNKQPDQSYFDELFRVSKRQIIWGCNYLTFSQKHQSYGRIFWDKVTFDNDFADGEMAWTNCAKSIRKFVFMWNGMLQGKGINEGHINQGNIKLKEQRIHPNHKPIALYKWLLSNYANERFKILDTHMGSQSSRIAAFNMGFDYYGWELDPEYFEAGNKRFKEQRHKYKYFKMSQTQLFYNTTNLDLPDLTAEIKNAISQEQKVKDCFIKYKGYLNPFQVSKLTGIECINSTRRAMTNLTKKGFLIKTDLGSKGDYGKKNMSWALNDNQ